MKYPTAVVTALAVISLVTATLPAMAAGSCPKASVPTAGTAVAPLSEAEVATLQWMREEEKLARDVYTELAAYWPAQVFVRIAASEQKHFDAIGKKLEFYGIPDVALPNVGDFADPALQAMHDDLLARGVVSYIEALQVGVAIENADLTDLQVAIDGTDSAPLERTYQHLLTGSEHHLAAFTKLLEKAGVIPEY
jgi:hypothetical protein